MRDRRTAGTMSSQGVDVARGHLFKPLCTALQDPGTVPDIQRFARHLTVGLPAMFSFLVAADLDATNWRAEHAVRPAVITRKMCGGGNRSRRGADTQQILVSLLRTAQQRHLDPTAVLTTLLCAPAPIVSPHFDPTEPSVN